MEPFFLRKILVLHKMGKMGNFWAQNQHFWTFHHICLLDFSEIELSDKHEKVVQSEYFGFPRKIFCFAQNGRIGSILGPKSTRFNFSLKMFVRFFWSYIWWLSIPSLNANATKWSNTFKQFTGFCRRIVGVCLTILWSWCVKG